MTDKKFLFCAILIIGIFISSSGVSAYVQSSYSSSYNRVAGLGTFSGGTSLALDESMCAQGTDFIVQISPLSCEPAVVTSDLLAEENVNVFCKLTGYKMNPLIDVSAIDAISFSKEYPKEVLSIGYMPAQAALGYVQPNPAEGMNLAGSLLLDNLGYVVITLRKQPNESALTNCKKTVLGTQICYVSGNLTATLRYDVENAFGVGSAVFYLPELEESEWQKDYLRYSFWDGRGYVRARAVDDDSATLSVYSDNNIPSSLISGQRTYKLAEYRSNIHLDVGETSDKIFLPGLSPCLGNLQLQLLDVENPDTVVQLRVNEQYMEVKENEKFLDNKCNVKDIDKTGIKQEVKISCREDSGTETYIFTISPKVDLEITDGAGNKHVKSYEVGDYLYSYGDADGKKNIYLGYIGTYTDISTISNPEDLFVYLIALPQEHGERLSESELVEISNYVDNIISKTGKFDSVKTFLESIGATTLKWSMDLGKYVILGKEFKIVPYLDVATNTPALSYAFKGHDVALIGFSITDNEDTLDEYEEYASYYKDAINDFEKDINSYPGEVESEDSVQTFGERALMEEIKLAGAVGQKKTMLDLCKQFVQDYPNSLESVDFCTDLIQLSNIGITEQDVTINNEIKRISFDGISEPSVNDYSATVVVKGEKKTETYRLRKNTPLQLKGFKTSEESTLEYINLEGLDTTKATINLNLAGCEKKDSTKTTSETFSETFTKGETQSFCGYTFTVTDITLNKVAKVSIIPGIDLARSSSNFGFTIGVEKRAIQLSPEKAEEKIIRLNNTIDSIQKISNYLNGVVKTMRAACVATEAVLVIKNFAASKDGTAIARQAVMTSTGGWNDKCKDLMKSDPDKYKSLNDCFLVHSKDIEEDVDTMASAIKGRNLIVKSLGGTTDSNDADFLKKYSNRVDNTLNSLSSKLSDEEFEELDLDKLKQVLNSGTTSSLIEKGVYNVDSLNEIETYALYLLNNSNSGELKEMALNKLKSEISEVTVNSERYVNIASLAGGLQINPDHVGLIGAKEEDKRIYQGDTLGSINLKISNLPSTTPVGLVQSGDVVYVLVLDTLDGKSKNYPVKQVLIPPAMISSMYLILTTDGNLVTNTEVINKLKNLVYQVVDSSEYTNLYISSYGEKEPLVYYFDSPYQNLPAVVPLDFKNGWYVGVENPSTSYDDSGVIRQFWICNVGSDGIESFQISNPRFGGDNCHLIVSGEMQTAGSVSQELINRAKNAVESVEKQYKSGITKVTVSGLITSSRYSSKTVKVGKPVSQTSSRECTDYWPVEDCVILFNICDPVVCPSSRCNLGGNYYVKNVVQSGIIGSIALCYPNAKWEGGDVYIPFCLSGISAGVEALISVLQANADCLQRNIDTGELVGICDYKNSVYLCELVWEQSTPVIKYFSQKIIDKIEAKSGKGGGEYMSFSSALKNVDDSIDYFTQYYSQNSYRGYGGSSTDTVAEGTFCGSFASFVVGDLGTLINNIISPDSPYQFIGKFEETQLTTATNPPTSKYKVWYHIYAGTETGAYYYVYLRGSGTSYYQDTANNRMVASGYIERGGYADESIDFTAPSGYSKLCINVNGHEECGFKEVSTSFAVDYLSDLYVADEAGNTNITSQDKCISGTASLYSVIDLNLQNIFENLVNPELYTQGIVRTCSSDNPGAGTNEENWEKVGYCDDKTVGCWINIESVENAIEALNLEENTLNNLANASHQYLSEDYLTDTEFESAREKIKGEASSSERINYISSILNAGSAFYNYQKAYLYLQRGIAYGELARSAYAVYAQKKAEEAAKKAEEEAILTTLCNESIIGERIFLTARNKIGTDTTRLENGKIVNDNVCATFVSDVLIDAGGLSMFFSSSSLSSTSDRDAIVELVAMFKSGGYSKIDRQYWGAGLKPGDIIIWGCKGLSYCSDKPDSDEYQHITIFSKYTGSGIEVIHDPGTPGPVAYKTYTEPFGTSWYVTHVWRAVCVDEDYIPEEDKEPELEISYVSPIFEFQDGTSEQNTCYKYFDGEWHWMITSTGVGTIIRRTCNDYGRIWIDLDVFKDEIDRVPTDKSMTFIKSLQGKSYLEGLELLIERTTANKEGGSSNPVLKENGRVTSMNADGIFNVDLGSNPLDKLDYRFTNIWQWSADKIGNRNWASTDTLIVIGGGLKGDEVGEEQADVIKALDKVPDLYKGAAILFDPESEEVMEVI